LLLTPGLELIAATRSQIEGFGNREKLDKAAALARLPPSEELPATWSDAWACAVAMVQDLMSEKCPVTGWKRVCLAQTASAIILGELMHPVTT
jgi:hypothetical protein